MRRHQIYTILIFAYLLAAPPTTPALASSQVAIGSDVQINAPAYNALMPLTNGGYVGNATGGTTKDALTFNGGTVAIGTTSPAPGTKVDTSGPVKAAGTGSQTCSASTIGAIRYNAKGNYLEICSYP